MNIVLFKKSLRKIFYFIILCFMSPVIIMQAFKNKENVLFLPVLLFGIFLSTTAVAVGYFGIKDLVKSLIGKVRLNYIYKCKFICYILTSKMIEIT